MYNTNQEKIIAFRFKDPFAADKFVVCHATKGKCCRPNCDMGILNYKDQDLRFYSSVDRAMAQGFVPCEFCFPDFQNKPVSYKDGSHVNVDLDLLLNTVTSVNKDIGFEPLLPASKSFMDTAEKSHWKERKSSTSSSRNSLSLTKNEFDRLQLITIACRHIALAASSTVLEVSCPEGERKNSILMTTGKKRRRRGGVLGFKELAAKSRLSPWHFHRVFKNVTGLTPKNYGDRCCSYIRQHSKDTSGRRVIVINTRIANPTLANEEEHQLQYEAIHSGSQKNRQARKRSMPVISNRIKGKNGVKGGDSHLMQISRPPRAFSKTPGDGAHSSLALAAEKRKSLSSIGGAYKKARMSLPSAGYSHISETEQMVPSDLTTNEMFGKENDLSNFSRLSENSITSFANPFQTYVPQGSNSSPTSFDFMSSELTGMSPRSLNTELLDSRSSQNSESLSRGSNLSMSASPTYEYTSGESNDVFAGLSMVRNNDQSALNAEAPYFYFMSPESEPSNENSAAPVAAVDSANNNINFAELMAVAPGTESLADTGTGFNFGGYNEPQGTASQMDLNILSANTVQARNIQNDHKRPDPVLSNFPSASFLSGFPI